MHILIADDHPLYREALAGVLGGLGSDVQVSQAETFDEVVKLVSGENANFDLILLDLYMAGGDWAAVIGELCEKCPTIPVIVISGSDSRRDAEQAMKAGAYGYIPKSLSKEEILSAIRLIMSSGVSIQPRESNFSETEPKILGSQDDIESRIASLTARQRDVLAEIGAGKSNKLIARTLGMTEGTVKLHVAAILKCLGMANRTQAAIAASGMRSPYRTLYRPPKDH